MSEYTLSIIKPDAVKVGAVNEINVVFLQNGIEIFKQKRLRLTREQAELFYEEHKEKNFFSQLCNFMTSGEVVVQILKGENVIARNREIMGHTNPELAEKGTIRATWGSCIDYNAVHGSDSIISAKREILFFFPDFQYI